jgi:hypothetical protein
VELLMVEDEKFFAWLDGELPADEAARVETEVAADSRLSMRAEEHRKMTAALRGAFSEVEAQPPPERLAGVLSQEREKVVDLVEVRERLSYRKPLSLWVQMGALAATLAIGIVTGNLLIGGVSSPIGAEGGRLVASAELEEALYARLASMPADAGPRIGLTFRDKSGTICRTFEEKATSGLACREGGDWRIRSLYQSPIGQTSDYRMASGQDLQLMEAVEASIDGEPFDAEQERAAKEEGWR